MSTKTSRVWIGGTSGLTRSYLNVFADQEWVLLGSRALPPSWLPSGCQYLSLDLTSAREASLVEIIAQLSNVKEIVVSLRPALVTKLSNQKARQYNEKLALGLKSLLDKLMGRCSLEKLIHISSIAAVGHLDGQYNQGLDVQERRSNELDQPYDYFKKLCEEIVLGYHSRIPVVTNVRLGAIFSDSFECIQCNALALQAYAGPFLINPIDCNSSRNVSHLIDLILRKTSSDAVKPIYYYTRPLYHHEPVPYGQYLVDYRTGNDIVYFVWVPLFVVDLFLKLVHLIARAFPILPYIESIDYLLQVSASTHSFDNSGTQSDFPDLGQKEETIAECFRRRRRTLS